jgi:hypothetical protein
MRLVSLTALHVRAWLDQVILMSVPQARFVMSMPAVTEHASLGVLVLMEPPIAKRVHVMRMMLPPPLPVTPMMFATSLEVQNARRHVLSRIRNLLEHSMQTGVHATQQERLLISVMRTPRALLIQLEMRDNATDVLRPHSTPATVCATVPKQLTGLCNVALRLIVKGGVTTVNASPNVPILMAPSS